MNMNQYARNYYSKGYSVIPLKPNSKAPAIYWEEYQERQATEEEFEGFDFGNIGIITGKVSGIVVLDIDGMDWVGSLQAAGLSDYLRGSLVSVVSGSGGLHIYLPWSEELDGIGNVYLYRGKDANVQLKTDGGYVVAPGSIHPDTGNAYELQTLAELPAPRETLPAPPPELYAAIQKRLRGAQSEWTEAPETINEGSRNRTLFSHARKLFQHGYSERETFALLALANSDRCKPQMEDDEVERIVESAATYERGSFKLEKPSSTEEEELGTLLTDVETEEVTWLWDGRIPYGKLTILDGDPGLGKSVMTLDLAARVTTGRAMPSGGLGDDDILGGLGDVGNVGGLGNLGNLDNVDNLPGGVVILSAEDGLADTIKPRLETAGADCSKILELSTLSDGDGGERLLSIPGDIDKLERGISRVGAKLVIIDPLVAFMQADSNKDNEVRKALSPLKNMAERTGVAVVMVRHLNKSESDKAIYRGGGSIGIVGAARCGLAVAKDRDNEDLRVLASTKENLSRKAASLSYTVIEENNNPLVEWRGEIHHSADDLLATSDFKPEKQSDVAEKFLRETLANGPMQATEVKELAENEGIATRTLDRAKTKAGVESKKRDGSWWWSIQGCQERQERQVRQDYQVRHSAPFDELDADEHSMN
jgi:RecA-family ATPase